MPSPLICFSHDLVILSSLYRGGDILKNGDFLTKYKIFLQNCKFYSIFRTSPVSTVPAAAAKSCQSCPTLCNPTDGSPPGSSVPGILQARMGCHLYLKLNTVLYAIQFNSVQFSHSVVSNSLRPHGLQPIRLLCPWNFPGKSTGVGCHCLLQILTVKSSLFTKIIFPYNLF